MPWSNSRTTQAWIARERAETEVDFPKGARVGWSQDAIDHTARHGAAWGEAKAKDRGTVVGYGHRGVKVRWDPIATVRRPDPVTDELRYDLQVISAAGGGGGLAGAFQQAAGAMGFQPPWGGTLSGLGAPSTYGGNPVLVGHLRSGLQLTLGDVYWVKAPTGPFRTAGLYVDWGSAHPQLESAYVKDAAAARKLLGQLKREEAKVYKRWSSGPGRLNHTETGPAVIR